MIYLITNNITGDCYIGKTTRTMAERWYQHIKNAEYGQDTYLYRAMRKYGINSFTIEYLSDGLDDEEIMLIEKIKPEYNMTFGGDGGRTADSPNYKEGMLKRRSYKGEGNPNYGKRGENSPNYGRRNTPEQIERCRQGYKGKRVPVKVHGIDYDSVKSAANALGRSERYVRLHDERNEWTY